MCMASLSDYDVETARQMCELEAMFAERRRKQLLLDAGIRARANRFMPTTPTEVKTPSPVADVEVVGAQLIMENAA